MQHMLDWGEHQPVINVLAADTFKSLIKTNLEKTMDHLNS